MKKKLLALRRKDLNYFIWMAAVPVLTFLAYTRALHANFVWDDDAHVITNPAIQTLQGLHDIWFKYGAVQQYYPLTYTNFWLMFHLWQLHPLGYHLVNIGLHSVNAILVGVLLQRLKVPGALLAALLFALHPVHVESVAWISEFKNLSSGFFYLLAMLHYLKFAGINASRRSPAFHYGISLCFFVMALLSKTVTCSLPAIILLILWWKKGKISRQNVYALIPFFLIGFVLALYTAAIESVMVGARGAEWSFTWLQRILMAGRASWFYAGKLLWPHPLMFIYPRWTIDPTHWTSYLYSLGVIVGIGRLWMDRRQIGRGPFVAVSFFLMTLVPALGFFNTYPMLFSFVADHFQYLASIGLLALVAAGITKACRNRPDVFRFISIVLCLLLGSVTWHRVGAYQDEETLWRDTLAQDPPSALAHHNLGFLLLKQGKLDEAAFHLEETLKQQPEFPQTQFTLGFVLTHLGRYDEAVTHYRLAKYYAPNHVEIYTNLASTLLRMGKTNDAIAEYQDGLLHWPHDPLLQQGLKLAQEKAGHS